MIFLKDFDKISKKIKNPLILENKKYVFFKIILFNIGL
jgi:hypothetical protein